jgi:hypothetical protein
MMTLSIDGMREGLSHRFLLGAFGGGRMVIALHVCMDGCMGGCLAALLEAWDAMSVFMC